MSIHIGFSVSAGREKRNPLPKRRPRHVTNGSTIGVFVAVTEHSLLGFSQTQPPSCAGSGGEAARAAFERQVRLRRAGAEAQQHEGWEAVVGEVLGSEPRD